MQPIDKIIQGDALDVLKKIDSNFIDVGITSPPYNKGEKHKGWLVKNVRYDEAQDNIPEVVYQNGQVDVLNEIYRVIKPGGSFFYNHKVRWEQGNIIHPLEWLLKTKWTIRQEIIWDRMIAANIRGWRFWQTDEKIFWLFKPLNGNKIGKELKSRHALLTSIWKISPERKNLHPAPFPLILPVRAIFSILDGKKGIVLDPYAGSGTTMIAAKLLDSNYVGIDISKKYIDMATIRLKNYKTEEKTIREELSKHVVKKTFAERKRKGEFTGKFRNGQDLNFQPSFVTLGKS